MARLKAIGFPTVPPDWLIAHLRDPKLRIIDVRDAPQRFVAGSVCLPPNSGWENDMLELAVVMSQAGVEDDQSVVVVGEDGTGPALRLASALLRHGHKATFVLAGGFPAWARIDGPVSEVSSTYPPSAFTVRAPSRTGRGQESAVPRRHGRSRLQPTGAKSSSKPCDIQQEYR